MGYTDYQEYLFYVAKTQNWAEIGYNEDCFLKAVYPEIFSRPDYDDEDEFGEGLKLAFLVLVLAGF